MSFAVCACDNRREKIKFCNARGRYKKIWPAEQPIKSLVLSLPYNKTNYKIAFCSTLLLQMSIDPLLVAIVIYQHLLYVC